MSDELIPHSSLNIQNADLMERKRRACPPPEINQLRNKEQTLLSQFKSVQFDLRELYKQNEKWMSDSKPSSENEQ